MTTFDVLSGWTAYDTMFIVAGCLSTTIERAEAVQAPTRAAYQNLVAERVAPLLWLAMPVHDGPEPTRRPPAVRARDWGRLALAAVVEFWPGDLDGVGLSVRIEREWRCATVRVEQDWEHARYAMTIVFSAEALMHRSPVVRRKVQLAYHRWTRTVEGGG